MFQSRKQLREALWQLSEIMRVAAKEASSRRVPQDRFHKRGSADSDIRRVSRTLLAVERAPKCSSCALARRSNGGACPESATEGRSQPFLPPPTQSSQRESHQQS